MIKIYRAFLVVFALVSIESFADQQFGRLSIKYGAPIIFNQAGSSAVNTYPPEVRSRIKSYSLYSGGKFGDIEKLDVLSVELGPELVVLRDGFMRPIDAIRNMPGVSEFSYEVSDVITSGYPSVRAKYKGKFKKVFMGGEILYVYDVGTSSVWTVSAFYFWNDGFFGDYGSVSKAASLVLDGVIIK